jgi:hypothetical protein
MSRSRLQLFNSETVSMRPTRRAGRWHAVDLETGAIVAVTLHGADEGDTSTIVETAIAAAHQVEDAQADVDEPTTLQETVADKGYHGNQTMVHFQAVASGPTSRSRIEAAEIGPRSPMRNTRCTPTDDAFAARAARRCSGAGANTSSERSVMSTTPAACDGRT